MIILTYHTFSREPTNDMFRRHIQDFAADLDLVGHHVKPLSEVVRNKDGMALCFDDASISQWEIAIPTLIDRNLPAAFCVATSLIGTHGYMSWDDLRALNQLFPLSIQSHGVSHQRLSEMSRTQAVDEGISSREKILEEVGDRPWCLATPFGEWTAQIASWVAKAGYDAMRTTEPTDAYTDDHCLPSFVVKSDSDLSQWLPINASTYWGDVYSKGGTEPGGHEHLRFAAIKRHIRGPNVVDVGAGYAQLCKELHHENPTWSISAVDFSDSAREASSYRPYYLRSAYDLPFEHRSQDSIVCSCTMEYLDDERMFLKEAKRVGKQLILVVPAGKNERNSQLRSYTIEGLTDLLAPFGEVVECYREHGFILGVVRFA